MYGIRVYQTYALLTESEYQQLVEYSPSELKRKSFTLPFHGPLQNQQFWLVDLKDLEPAVANCVRKVDVTYSTQAQLEQVFLNAEQQIQRKQPWTVFEHRAAKHFDKRPDALRPAAQRPYSVDQLVEQHLLEKSKRTSQVAAAAQGSAELALPERRELPERKLGLAGDDDDDAKPSKRKRGAAAGVRARVLGFTASEPPTMTHAADQKFRPLSPPRSMGSSLSKKPGKGAKNRDEKDAVALDVDMKQVADAHLSTQTGSSVKSLVTLSDPLSFLLPVEDAGSVKTHTNAISAAGSSAVFVLRASHGVLQSVCWGTPPNVKITRF